MEKYVEKKIEQTKKVLVGIVCDHCGKEIKITPRGSRKAKYYHVATYHHDWGNDSIDSHEHFDFCSYECLKPHQDSYFNSADGSEEYEISVEWT